MYRAHANELNNVWVLEHGHERCLPKERPADLRVHRFTLEDLRSHWVRWEVALALVELRTIDLGKVALAKLHDGGGMCGCSLMSDGGVHE
jgi:hypothetical protein